MQQEQSRVRKTYLLTQEIIDALELYSVDKGIEKSDVVKAALEMFIPDRFISSSMQELLSLSEVKDKRNSGEQAIPHIHRTYVVPYELVRAVKLMAHFEKRNGNEIVRSALKFYIPQPYFRK
jgi:hypothetical protein